MCHSVSARKISTMDRTIPKIGNENFKNWLRLLDANTRVGRISSIAISLRKMNVRGSDIKAALAQLSQMCLVMTPKLTEKQISYYTRRKQIQKLIHQNSSQENENESFKSSSVIYKSNSKNHNYLDSYHKKKKKKKALMKELFGEDDTEEYSIAQSYKKGYNKLNDHLSVNVNYSNTPSSSTCAVKISNCFSNSTLEPVEPSPKKLKLNLSFANNEHAWKIKENKKLSDITSKERPCSNGSYMLGKRDSAHKHSKRKSPSSKKKRPKKVKQKKQKSTLKIATEDDPSIKELWSILGMESPRDRTAKCLSDCLKSNSSEKIALHSASEGASSTDVQSRLTELVDNSNISVSPEETINTTKPASTAQSSGPGEGEEPFLTISETFSLASTSYEGVNTSNDMQTDGDNRKQPIIDWDKGKKQYSHTLVNSEKTMEAYNHGKIPILKDTMGTSKQSCLEISSKNKLTESKSKIGTIRVKSLGSLVDPQLRSISNYNMPHEKENQSSSNLMTSNDLTKKNLSSSTAEINEHKMEDHFVATYRYYFDDLVEAKIPKLGELLHLALADNMRKDKTIRKAEQLSSLELIRDEKLRAKKDYDDKMKSRGIVFHSLIETIINKFDVNSRLTLFIALFCRILQHAGTIDPANEDCITTAKHVITSMLISHKYKDQAIIKLLQDDKNDFETQVEAVKALVAKCVPKINYATQSTSHVSDNNVQPGSELVTCSSNLKTNKNTVAQPLQKNGTPDRNKKMLPDGKKTNCINERSPALTTSFNRQLTSDVVNRVMNNTATQNIPNHVAKQTISREREQSLVAQQTITTPDSNRAYQRTYTNKNDNTCKAMLANGSDQPAKQNNMNFNFNPHNVVSKTAPANPNEKPKIVMVQTSNVGDGRYLNCKAQPSVEGNKKETPNRRNSNMTSQSNSTANASNFPTVNAMPPHLVTTTVSSSIRRPFATSVSSNDFQSSRRPSGFYKLPADTSIMPSPRIIPSTASVTSDINPPTQTVVLANKNSLVTSTVIPSSTTSVPSYTPHAALISSVNQVSTTFATTRGPLTSTVSNSFSVRPTNTNVRQTRFPAASKLASLLKAPVYTPSTTQGTFPYANNVAPLNSNRTITHSSNPDNRTLVDALTRLIATRGGFSNNNYQSDNMLNRPPPQIPISIQNNPVAQEPLNVVDPNISVNVRKDAGQIVVPNSQCSNQDNTSRMITEEVSENGSSTPAFMSLSVTTSHIAPPSSEIGSPTAEPNLPSSSHCHPFIARRPISGKMKMLFDSSNS